MIIQNEARHGANVAGSADAFPDGNCSSENAPKARVAQAKIALLVDDLTDTAGWLVTQLSVLPSQRAAADYSGILYTLRRSRCYWRHIAETARELTLANDNLLSALRQSEDGQ